MSNKFTGLKVFIFSLVLMLLNVSITNAQIWAQAASEQFPNTFNTSATGPINSTFVGNMGTWGAYSDQSYAKVTVTNYNYLYTSPNSASLRIYPGASAANAQITSPTIDLSPYACSEKFDISTNFNIDKLTANTGTIFYIEISNDNGATWSILYQKTATQFKAAFPGSGYQGIMLQIPTAYLVSTFKFRYRLYQPAGSTYDSEIRFDDLDVSGWPCREYWDNLCSDNKTVDFYSKGMQNSCVNGTMGWTNIGTTEGLNMTNATKAVAYVSMNETFTPGQTVTIRSKNSSGTVIQTQTATLKANHYDPSTMNIYEATFTTSLSSVASFEATISGSCSLTNEYNPNYIANGFGISIQRTGVTGYENHGHNLYWGSPGFGTGDYWKEFDFQPVAYQRTALLTVSISGLADSKRARIKVWPQTSSSYYVDVIGNDPLFGSRTTMVTIPVIIPANETFINVSTDQSVPTNGMYSIDMVKFEVPCTNSLKIGNIVFNDANNNGVKDGAETGIANTKVYLFRDANLNNVPDGQPIQITTTDASGNYYFDGLLAGSYIVGVKIPNGYSSAITTATSSNPNNDTDNDNNGVTYNATSGLLLSNYITLSVGGEPTTDGDADNNSNLSLDFGLKTNACVKTTESFPNTFNTGFVAPINSTFIGNTGTWSAYSSNGFSTVVVVEPYYLSNAPTLPGIKLVNSAIGAKGTDSYSQATSPSINASGNCCPMQTKLNFDLWTYVCNVNDPYSYFYVDMSGDGGTTWTRCYQLRAADMYIKYGDNSKVSMSIPVPTNLQTATFKYRVGLYSDWNMGYNFYVFVDDFTISSPVTCATGSIGDYVWNDANMNGSQDVGETGISGVSVTLKDENGSPIATTTTNASGNYTFSNLPAGNYQVSFTTPSGYNPTWNDWAADNLDSDPIGGTIKNVSLTTGQVRTDIDAGFFPICSTLFSETFPNTYNLSYTTPTNGTFTGSVGTYTVASSDNYAGLVVASDNTLKTLNYYDASQGTHSVTLTSPTMDLVQGTGCTQWVYLNFDMYPVYINTPVGSDAYKVYIDFSGDGGSTWSNAWAMNGADIVQYYGLLNTYNVSVNLTPGVYTSNFKFRLRAVQSAGAYCDNYIVYDNFQIRKCPCPPLNLGNLVWIDTNNNGIKDGAEVGVNGATVKLYNDNNGDNVPDGAAVATTTTNASGVYSFGTLVPGSYIVGVVIPGGYTAATTTATSSNPNNDTDNDNNGVTTVSGELRSNYITLTVGGEPASGVDGDGTNGNLTLDFGIKSILSCTGNLLANSGFETGDFTSWTSWGNNTITTDANTGTKAAQVYSTTAGGGFAQVVAVTPGNMYTLNVYAKLTGGTEWASVGLTFLDASYTSISDNVAQVTATSYTNMIVNGVAPANAAYVQVYAYKDAGTGTLKVDDYCLTSSTFTCNSNLVLNPGLESSTTFQNWSTDPTASITTDAYAGTKAVQISGGQGGISQQLTANPGDVFTLKAFAKVDGTTEWSGLQLAFYNSSFTLLDGRSTTIQYSTSYTEYTVSATAPAGTAYVIVGIWKGAGTSILKVDEFNLCKTVTATPLNLGNVVWNDINNNGTKDAGETGISGVTVKLYQDANADNTPDGVALQTTVTNTSGTYNFNNLPAGNYIVGVVIPNGYTNGATTATSTNPNSDTDNDNNGITVVSGEVRTNYITLTIGGEPLSGVDGDGANGNLTLDCALKLSCSVSSPDVTINNLTYGHGSSPVPASESISINGGSTLITINNVAGFNITSSTEGVFWAFCSEVNQPVLPLSNPYIHAANGSTNGLTIAQATRVGQVVQAAGFNATTGFGAAGNTITNFTALQFAIWNAIYDNDWNATTGTFQVTTDNNGARTLANTWLTAASSITYPSLAMNNLYSLNGQNLLVLTNMPSISLTATQPTCAISGAYGSITITGFTTGQRYQYTSGTTFSGAPTPASITTIPAGGVITTTLPNTSSYYTVRIYDPVDNSCYTDRIIPIIQTTCLNLGNNVWFDVNNNGIKDASETGVTGATVRLYQDANADNTPDGVAVATTTTDASGAYSFANLPAGNYIVGVVLPAGYVSTVTTANSATPNSDTDNDNNGVTTVSGELRSNYITLSVGGEPASGVDGDGTNGNLTLDFGLKGSLNLGNLIWNDYNGNGIKDVFESGINGITVYLYLDANGDNVPDGAAITSTTTAGGGLYSFTNLVPGNYIVGYQLPTGYANGYKPTNNANPNSDTDSDNNGVTTASGIVRSNYITLSVGGEPSTDGDGTNGNLTLDFGCAKDTDGDGVPDVIDIDDDNDGITDVKESGGYDPLGDCDNDGTPNYLDTTPGCTTPSGNDAWGNPFTPLTWSDCNSDGINDFFDKDRDGIINELDLDADNDGILDVQEARPGGVAVGSTSNGQIIGTDADADGLLSSQDNNQASPYNDGIAAQDLDRDGIPNFLDLDSDGDGINDLTEALNTYDADGIVSGTDTDGDGVRAESWGSSAASIADNINGLGAKGISLLDTDGDGKPNAYDIDSDADGITDNAEAQATCTYILPTGTDCDKDGVDDAYEAGGSCACAGRTTAGVTPYDKDGDGTPDYLDTDTDGDGVPDIYEGHTIKTSNYWTGSTGDADGDGLIDYFDTFSITAASSNFFRNVVNKNMGTNGDFYEGTGGIGSASQLPESDGKTCATSGDRDWRMITILPATLLNFNGNLDNAKIAHINWVVTNEVNMSSYTLERSVDGVNFTVVTNKAAINSPNLNSVITYNAEDNLSTITTAIVYYRLRMTDRSNNTRISNVINFKLYDKGIVGATVYPNPAKSSFTLKLTSEKDENVQIKIVDKLGKEIMSQKTQIVKGINTIPFNDVSKLSSGVYMIQIYMNGEIYTERLIIAR